MSHRCFLFALALLLPGLAKAQNPCPVPALIEVLQPGDIAGIFDAAPPSGIPGNWGDTTGLTPPGLTGNIVHVEDDGTDPGEACVPITNPDEIAGNIALIRRGECEFGLKALHAQQAGATGFIVYNDERVPDDDTTILEPPFMGGGAFGPEVFIPGVFVSRAVGLAITDQLLTFGNAVVGNIRYQYCWVSTTTLTLTPADPPVVVPRGGDVPISATLFVPEGGPSSVDYWSEATLPDGEVRQVFGPGTLLVSPGIHVRTFLQHVASSAPPGGYTYTMKVGTYPGTVLAQDSFTGTVTATAGVAAREGEAAGEQEWRLYDEAGNLLVAGSVLDLRPAEAAAAEEAVTAASSELPSVPALHAPYPNPFGTEATVRYDVPAAGAVRVAVYDLLGREVAILADGTHEAGRFAVALDGRAFPSGVYLVRMRTAGFVQAQRVTLLR